MLFRYPFFFMLMSLLSSALVLGLFWVLNIPPIGADMEIELESLPKLSSPPSMAFPTSSSDYAGQEAASAEKSSGKHGDSVEARGKGGAGQGKYLEFELRQVHSLSNDAQVIFRDVPPRPKDEAKIDWNPTTPTSSSAPTLISISHPPSSSSTHRLKTRKVKTFKPPPFQVIQQARTWSRAHGQSLNRDASGNRPLGYPDVDVFWEEEEVEGPDVEDRQTLLELAKMTNNAYVEPQDPAWYDLGDEWVHSYPFGWDADGFRGHVFSTPDNSTVVLSIKGTSAAVFGGAGPTAKKDKFNDNLLFSCCCARVDWSWSTVCGCFKGAYKCDEDCLDKALIDESLFYPIGTNLYYNLTYMYPDADLWIIGHSLGGALAGLLGNTFGAPVVAFDAPGEKMAAARLHLPTPPSTQHVVHVYHTADPIAMGICNGVLSSCALGGYAMESRCHLGETIIFDTVTELGWAVDIRTHGIVSVIDKLLSLPWSPSEKEGRQVPKSSPQDDCMECYSWEYV